jgi:hypothetical protein
MAGRNNGHEASASAAGYLYQCRIALLSALKAIPTNPDLSISVERFDDVAFDQSGTPAEMIQTKHHIGKTGNLTDASSDLWKTLLIWAKIAKADVEAPFRTKFVLLTTGTAPSGSAAFYLRPFEGERDENKADEHLLGTADTSVAVDNQNAYTVYKSLSKEVRLSLLRAITVLDNAPDILDVVEDIRQTLYHAAPKEQIGNFVERLEGWWFGTVITAMVKKQSIPVLAIDQRIDELREEFKRKALPVDFKSTVPSADVIADLDDRPFVQQLRKIEIGGPRIEYAIRDYYRASEQRSRWLRQELLPSQELDQYEQELKEAWEPRFSSVVDSLPNPCSTEEKVAGGQKIFKWAEQDADFPLRTVKERFLTHGSFHILANRNTIGWHPDYDKDAQPTDDKEKK